MGLSLFRIVFVTSNPIFLTISSLYRRNWHTSFSKFFFLLLFFITKAAYVVFFMFFRISVSIKRLAQNNGVTLCLTQVEWAQVFDIMTVSMTYMGRHASILLIMRFNTDVVNTKIINYHFKPLFLIGRFSPFCHEYQGNMNLIARRNFSSPVVSSTVFTYFMGFQHVTEMMKYLMSVHSFSHVSL